MGKAGREVERRVLRLLHGGETRRQLPEIHAHVVRHGIDQYSQILAHFVSVCGSLNKMKYADSIFSQSRNPTILLFNSMIKGFSLCGPFERSLGLFAIMRNIGIWPDEYTFAPLLKACSNLRCYWTGQSVRAVIMRAGFERFGSVEIAIVELCVGCARMEDANKMFDEMLRRDVIAWNLMIRGFSNSGEVDKGLHFFRQMSKKNVVSWNSMISCLARRGRDGEALALFNEMRDQGFEPDDTTVVTVLPVCARSGAFDVGRRIHCHVDSTKPLRQVVAVWNSLIDFYCKSGDLGSASSIFKQMHRKDVVSWNVMISGLAMNGRGERGVELFEEMVEQGTNPNESTFVGVLTCCAHAGMVEEGRRVFALMAQSHQIRPKLQHYGCMIDVLGRAGCTKEAHDLIRSMPVRPNAVLWGSLLSSCRTHGDLQLAEVALHELINLEPWNSGNYVLLSNMFAEEGRWDKVEKLRELMKEICVNKAPAQSLIT